jgi:hypothetical protein
MHVVYNQNVWLKLWPNAAQQDFGLGASVPRNPSVLYIDSWASLERFCRLAHHGLVIPNAIAKD